MCEASGFEQEKKIDVECRLHNESDQTDVEDGIELCDLYICCIFIGERYVGIILVVYLIPWQQCLCGMNEAESLREAVLLDKRFIFR